MKEKSFSQEVSMGREQERIRRKLENNTIAECNKEYLERLNPNKLQKVRQKQVYGLIRSAYQIRFTFHVWRNTKNIEIISDLCYDIAKQVSRKKI